MMGQPMSENPDQPRSEADAQLEREVRAERKFTLAEAIGRLAGPGLMKGASPVTRKQQAESEIQTWLRQHVADTGGALPTVLLRRISASEKLLDDPGQPLDILSAYCQEVLGSEFLLADLVRDADVEWGRTFGERPHFEKKGSAPHPDDRYTLESVRSLLSGLVAQLTRR
jgi:hypothetical protein